MRILDWHLGANLAQHVGVPQRCRIPQSRRKHGIMGGVAAESSREGKWRGNREGIEGVGATRGEQEAGPWSMRGNTGTGHHRESQREAKRGKLEILVGRSCRRWFELVWRTVLEGVPPFLLALGVFLETLGPHDWAAAGCCCYSLTHQYV